MPQESDQQRISRVRTPRVHITYEVETEGSQKDVEIPFVVGVLADLSGQPKEPLPPMEERDFIEIDRDNLDKVMADQKPRLQLTVPDRLTESREETKLSFELTFNSLADFHPDAVAKKIEPLRELLELRNKLASLQNRLYGNSNLEKLLKDAVRTTKTQSTSPAGEDTVQEGN